MPGITEAIEQAQETHKDQVAAGSPGAVAAAKEVKEEVKEAAPEIEEIISPDNFGLSDTEQLNALQLFAALKDPVLAPDVLKILAEKGGYTKSEIKELKQDLKEATTKGARSEIQQELEEALEGMPWLAEKLAPVLEKIIDKKVATGTKDLRASQESTELERLKVESNVVYTELAREFYGKDDLPDAVFTALTKLMDEVPPQPTMTLARYIRFLFNDYAATNGVVKHAAKARTERARNDVPGKLASERTGAGQATIIPGSTKMNLTDSVQAAIDAVNAELEK